MITVVAKNFVKNGEVNTVLNICENLVKKSREESGCIKYEVFQEVKNENIVTMIEEWKSMEDLEAHFEMNHFKDAIEKLAPHMEKEAEISLYKKTM